MTHPVRITLPEGQPFIEIEREFDAPVEAVFEAHRDPALLSRWLGPDGYDMEIEEYRFESGGRYRYTHRAPDGAMYSFRGVFHVVRPNEFAVQTFEFEGMPDVVSIESMRFERLPQNRTRLRGHSVYPSVEARDGMAESGMERGITEGYRRLDQVTAGGDA